MSILVGFCWPIEWELGVIPRIGGWRWCRNERTSIHTREIIGKAGYGGIVRGGRMGWCESRAYRRRTKCL